jgi:hypothetical protein
MRHMASCRLTVATGGGGTIARACGHRCKPRVSGVLQSIEFTKCSAASAAAAVAGAAVFVAATAKGVKVLLVIDDYHDV